MKSGSCQEDLLIAARRGDLTSEEAARFSQSVASSRELRLLYEAGCGCDAQARLLLGDEQRITKLIQNVMRKVDGAPGGAWNAERPAESRSTETSSRQEGHALESGGPRKARAGFLPPARSTRIAARSVAGAMGFGMLLGATLVAAWELALRLPEPGDQANAGQLRPQASLSASAAPTSSPAPIDVSKHQERSAQSPPNGLSQASHEAASQPDAPRPARRNPPPSSRPATILHLEAPAAAARAATSMTSASQLFADGSRARRERRTDAAIALYERLLREHPNSLEASDAKIVLGKLQLTQSATQAALQQFQESHASAVSAEALWGESQALRELNEPKELDVLHRLVDEYPNSPYASAARVRIAQLGRERGSSPVP